MNYISNFDVPPYIYLSQVLKHCPSSAYTYLELWRSRDDDNKICVHKKEIPSRFLINRKKFADDLLKLVREGLLSIDESKTFLQIELVDFEDEENF